jgi:hypothetical protein
MKTGRNRSRVLLSVVTGLVASISIAYGIDKDKNKFDPGPASAFATKQTNNGVTIAAEAYETEALAQKAFGKANPYMHGVLPVLVVVQNDSKNAVSLSGMRAEYMEAGRDRVEATPPRDVPFLGRGPQRPTMVPSPIPGIAKKKKNPLMIPEIETRAFAAKMLPPGESAYGFFYFQTGHRRGAKLYVTGLTDAPSGQDLLFFDIPLETH